MTITNELDASLLEGIRAIEPFLDRLVLAGGWVPYIYSRVYGVGLHRDPLITRDIDLVISRRGFIDSVPPLDKAIVAAGFRHEFASLDNPPVVKYVKELDGTIEVEIEFITDAPGQREGTVKIGSVNAQSLRHVGLLLEEPWEVNLNSIGFDRELIVRVPRPAAYVLHKSLIAGRRRHKKRTAKDLYYIFYTLESFPDWHSDAIDAICQYQQTHGKQVAEALGYLESRFRGIDSQGVDYLLSQRPATAFPGMTDDQFRQYALATMSKLMDAMRPHQ
jgi:hypothetical protein